MGTSSMPLVARVERRILVVRGQRVLLDEDLAVLYGVETRALVQAVVRNRRRFPPDFLFRLTSEEHRNLRSQFVMSSWGGRRTHPFAFTEQGVAMLSSVLRSERAIQVNVEIMRAFVRLRRILRSHARLAQRLSALEQRYDGQFRVVFDAIRQLMGEVERDERSAGSIGFRIPATSAATKPDSAQRPGRGRARKPAKPRGPQRARTTESSDRPARASAGPASASQRRASVR